MFTYFLLYLLLCLLVGALGYRSRLGFWGVAALSFIVTPFIGAVCCILFGAPSQGQRFVSNR